MCALNVMMDFIGMTKSFTARLVLLKIVRLVSLFSSVILVLKATI